jgi:phosphatidylserine/phosphatidylglycerophosphate/cardiolipin synthase-like enzyme
VGPETIARIRDAVTFRLPDARATLAPDGDPDGAWATLLARRPDGSPLARLEAALELLLARAHAGPDPAPLPFPEGTLDPPAPAFAPVAGIDVLARRYHAAVGELIAGAGSRVDVCMFHVALPSPAHPTRQLLDQLVAAHGRGVAVRVLTDSDRTEDPYLSTVINGPAIAVLRDAGVPVRVDTPEALLHSKFLVIDDDLAVVGSHNWSAGSYFTFDDLSLVLRTTGLAGELRARFDGLWAAGVAP